MQWRAGGKCQSHVTAIDKVNGEVLLLPAHHLSNSSSFSPPPRRLLGHRQSGAARLSQFPGLTVAHISLVFSSWPQHLSARTWSTFIGPESIINNLRLLPCFSHRRAHIPSPAPSPPPLMLLFNRSANINLPNQSGFWGRFKPKNKEPDLRQQAAQMSLETQRLLTLVFGEQESIHKVYLFSQLLIASHLFRNSFHRRISCVCNFSATIAYLSCLLGPGSSCP